MSELKVGTQVKLRNGTSCKVKKELGRGGQGIVYLVEYNGKDYALKWYIIPCSEAFYENLERNVKKGAPSPSFLWPEAVTEYQNDSFGYLMKLRPQGYEEIGAFMLAKAKFSSVNCLLKACLEICTAFQKLHINGLSYQDMNDGNFFINPQTGDVLICDNDNVAPNGVNMGIAGKSGYMAPEIVEKETTPNRYTDYFSLSVILFILLHLNRPFEGAKTLSCPCITEELDKKFFGKECVFILDPNDNSNRPVRGVHTNVIRRWPLFPKLLQNAFIKTFSKEAILTPNKRLIDRDWQDILVQVRSLYVSCPICNKYTFIDLEKDANVCMECGKNIAKPLMIVLGKYQVPLIPGQKIYQCQISSDNDYNKVVAEVIRNPNNPNKWGLNNFSGQSWIVITPSGEMKTVDNGKSMPLIQGLNIRFNKEITGKII